MANAKKIPMRKCVGCNKMKNKKELIRIIKTPDGEILLDSTGKKNGRGAYVCRSSECLRAAVKNKGLDRAFRMSVPQELYQRLEKEMDALG